MPGTQQPDKGIIKLIDVRIVALLRGFVRSFFQSDIVTVK
jgi:hypothetical protein